MTDFSRDSGRDRNHGRFDSRVPPHNLNAEESVLGALLLSRDVVDQVGELGVMSITSTSRRTNTSTRRSAG